MTEIIKIKLFCLILIVFCILQSSCSTTKHLKDDQILHDRTHITFVNPESFTDKKKIKRDVFLLGRPKPNNKAKLRFYNFMGGPNRTKGLWHWLGRKFGEPPKLYDPLKIDQSRRRINNYLHEEGYLGATVTVDTSRKSKRETVTYNLASTGRYYISSIHFPSDTFPLAQLIRNNHTKSILTPGAPYQLTALENERKRLTSIALNSGYINFNETDIFYLADTTNKKNSLSLFLSLRTSEDSAKYQKFFIGKTHVFPNYNLKNASSIRNDTLITAKGTRIIQNRPIVREAVIDRIIPHSKDDFYSKKIQDLSFTRLQSLGIFKFVNINYEHDTLAKKPTVNRLFYLTPGAMQELTGSLELNNQSGNYFGASAGTSYIHKNFLGGAERLNVNLSGGLATQLNSGARFINTFNVDFKASLSIPKIISPFKIKDFNNPYVPRTLFAASTGYQNRVLFYAIHTAELSMGYNWKVTPQKQHELYPVTFNMLRLINSTPEFESIRINSSRLKQSFDDVLIGGMKYAYTFTNQTIRDQRKSIYFTGEVESSGFMLWLGSQIAGGNQNDAIKINGIPISHFVKINADVRHFTKIKKSTLALRLTGGLGMTYGHTENLPYTRQFIIGGANSLRAFQLRELGPGSFFPEVSGNQAIDNQFLDQTGDIKIEMNIEYRFPVLGYLKGAIFLDAGNIWLLKDSEIPEGVFRINRFINEIAVGTGIGFRLDFNYFIIRLDTSFALRKPVHEMGFQWVSKDIALFDRNWRRDNLKWHLGIGYPF